MEKDRERDGTGVCSFPLLARLDNGLVRMTWLARLAGWFVVRRPGLSSFPRSCQVNA